MWNNTTNFNYALGFIIVLAILYISIIVFVSTKSERYTLTTDSTMPREGLTIITNEGVVNLDKLAMNHYLNLMKDNLEYLSRRVDSDKCEKIKKHLINARSSLQEQILKSLESVDMNQPKDIQEELPKIRENIETLRKVMFSNEQNPDGALDIILNMILDLETLTHLVKSSAYEIKIIDIRYVDQIAKIIYEHACFPEKSSLQTLPSELTLTEDSFETSPGNDLFIAELKKHPSNFETFADFNKHQNLSDHNNSGYRPNNMSYKTRKKNLKGVRKTSMLLGDEYIKKENHKSLHTQRRETKKLKEQHKDPIRDRFTNTLETFSAAHPNRHKKIKSSLIEEDSNDIEEQTLLSY
jgi:hypothetical protein